MDRLHAKHLLSNIRKGKAVEELTEHDRRLIFFVEKKGKYPVWEGLG
jgi:hypothetical protein